MIGLAQWRGHVSFSKYKSSDYGYSTQVIPRLLDSVSEIARSFTWSLSSRRNGRCRGWSENRIQWNANNLSLMSNRLRFHDPRAVNAACED